jgi:hypothetical protein
MWLTLFFLNVLTEVDAQRKSLQDVVREIANLVRSLNLT